MTGPDESMNDATTELIPVGRVRRPTGIKGAVLVEVYTGEPDRFADVDSVFLDDREFRIVDRGRSGNAAKLTFEGINSIERAQELRDREVSVPEDSLGPAPEGKYYHYELLEADVVDTNGKILGTVHEIIETGSNDVLVVRTSNSESSKPKEILIPVIDGVLVELDRGTNSLIVDPPPGLLN
ncbi:MAG: ribosome maturation factor RimM [Dehalococcoidia bacterium]